MSPDYGLQPGCNLMHEHDLLNSAEASMLKHGSFLHAEKGGSNQAQALEGPFPTEQRLSWQPSSFQVIITMSRMANSH